MRAAENARPVRDAFAYPDIVRVVVAWVFAGCSFSAGVQPRTDAAELDADAGAPLDAPVRVNRGLVALYTFDEGAGSIVGDSSGVAPALDLVIPAAAPVTWGTGALTVTGDTLIASPAAATKILDACRTADALTLEAWITPAIVGGYFPRVATLSETNASLAVTLMAIDSHFEFRMRGPMTDENGLPSLDTAVGSVALAPIHVVLVSEPGGMRRVYVNGVENVTDARGGDLATWGTGHRLGLANEIDGGRSWVGTFDRVAIYAAAHTQAEVEANHAAGP